METKWKILIISVAAYQIVLTLVILKLTHYSQWLYFHKIFESFPHSWYHGSGTGPMTESLKWLGLTLLILIIVNIVAFTRSGKNKFLDLDD